MIGDDSRTQNSDAPARRRLKLPCQFFSMSARLPSYRTIRKTISTSRKRYDYSMRSGRANLVTTRKLPGDSAVFRYSANWDVADSALFTWPRTRCSRKVALKVPRLEVLSGSESWKRFLREARAASRLDHPNLIPMLEAGAIGPVGYIVSAYVAGPSLEQWLRHNHGRVSPEWAARLVIASRTPSNTRTSGESFTAT